MLIACLLGEPVLGPAGSSPFFPSLTQAALASSQTCWCLTCIWCSALSWASPSHLPASLLALSGWSPAYKGCFLSFTGKRCSTWGSLCPTVPPEPIPLRDSIWGTAGMAALHGFVSWQKIPPVGLIELSVDVHHWARQQRPALEATDYQWSSEWSMSRGMDQHLWSDYRFWCGAMARFSASKNPSKMCGQNLLHTCYNQFLNHNVFLGFLWFFFCFCLTKMVGKQFHF